MLTLQDLDKEARGRDRYGHKVTLTSDALEHILRSSLIMPDGEIERIDIDNERLILTIYFKGERPVPNMDG